MMNSSVVASGVSRKVALVLAAALTVALAISLGNVAESSAGSHAVAAKKKCKKKGKKSAVAAKKCKKKKKTVVSPVQVVSPTGPPPSTVRATLTWNSAADLDLNVWDTSGTGGFEAFGIPNSQFPGDDTDGFGPESFVDLLSPSTRQFTFGICTADAAGTSTNFTLTTRYGDGTSDVWTQDDFFGPITNDGDWLYVLDSASYDPGDGDDPTTGWC